MEILKRASAIVVGLILGTILALNSPTFAFEDLSNDERAEKFGVIMDIIMDETVNEEGAADPDHLYNVAIKAVLKELDDAHGMYFTKEITKEVKEDIAPSPYPGIGTSIGEYKQQDGLIGALVITPFDGSPAKKAGLRSEDLITHVLLANKKWKAYEEGKLAEFINLIKGPVGTKVVVKVVRNGKKLGKITITRAKTKLQNVWVRVINKGTVIYVRIDEFDLGVAAELSEQILPIIKKLKKQKKLKGIVLDLRSNPGGLLFEATDVADLFINKGKEIITVKSRNAGTIKYISKWKPLVPENTPMVVLIDDGSASASELVAGALLQQKVAIILGVKSYGKGSVQTIVDISDGSAVKVTTARYYPAGGLNIDGVGVIPTIIVEPKLKPAVIQNPGDEREQQLNYYFTRTSADPKRDVQLRRAVKWIKAR